MSEVKHYRLDVYESNKSGEFETYVDMKESEPSRFTYVKSSDYDALKSKLEKAEAVISFYASEDTWINKEFDENNNFIGWTQKKPNDVSIFPYSIGNSNGNFHCLGRKAREYIKG